MADRRRLKLVRNPYILPLTASMFDWKFTINNLDSDGRDHIQFTNDAEKDIYIVYDLGDSQGMLKVRVSDLKSAGWNFTKFGKVRSIDPNSIGDNGLVQWHHHPIRPAPQGRLARSAR